MLEDVIKKYGGTEVDAMTVYRDMFSLGDGLIQRDGEEPGKFKANPIGYYRMNGEEKGHYRVFFDDTFEDTIKELQEADFAILNGITYFGRRNKQEHASKMYAMIFDLDGVTDSSLNSFLHAAFIKDENYYPLPNYVILSGHGVHLYYLFEKPIPLYPNIKIQLKAFKYALIEKIWNMYTSKEKNKQFQGINQGFRPIGGKTKIDGVRVRAFLINTHPTNLDAMGKYIPEESRVDEAKIFKETKMSLEEAKKAYPQWYEDKVVNKLPRKHWKIKRDLYDWWKRQIEIGATYHHRYFAIMCLAIYAAKCDVEYDELEQDALDFIPRMNKIHPEDPFTKEDVMSALECYDKRYCTFPKGDMERLSGIQMPTNRRNGRNQEVHLRGARALQQINDEANGTNWRDGNGRKNKADAIKEWKMNHPTGTKSQCHKETGMSWDTIRKWWEPVLTEEDKQRGGIIMERDGRKEIFFPVDMGEDEPVYMTKEDILDQNIRAGSWSDVRKIMDL